MITETIDRLTFDAPESCYLAKHKNFNLHHKIRGKSTYLAQQKMNESLISFSPVLIMETRTLRPMRILDDLRRRRDERCSENVALLVLEISKQKQQ